jgi:hypothetical protein
MPFSERDWKYLRGLSSVALQRYCTRVLDESAGIIQDSTVSPHERYLRLYRILQERDATMATAFDDLRRSNAIHRLSAMVGLGLLRDAELAGFGPDVQETARGVSDMFVPRSNAAGRRR